MHEIRHYYEFYMPLVYWVGECHPYTLLVCEEAEKTGETSVYKLLPFCFDQQHSWSVGLLTRRILRTFPRSKLILLRFLYVCLGVHFVMWLVPIDATSSPQCVYSVRWDFVRFIRRDATKRNYQVNFQFLKCLFSKHIGERYLRAMFDQCVTCFWFWGKLCQLCTFLYNMAVCKTVKAKWCNDLCSAKFILPEEWWQLWRFAALVFALNRHDFFCSSNFEVGSGGVSWPYNHSGACHRSQYFGLLN